jgi:hypothetical protein
VNEKEVNHPAHPMDKTANWCNFGGWFPLALYYLWNVLGVQAIVLR